MKKIVLVLLTLGLMMVVNMPVHAETHTFEEAESIYYTPLQYTSTYNTLSTSVGGFSEYAYVTQDSKRPSWLWVVDGFTTLQAGALTSYIQFGTTSAFTTVISGGALEDQPAFIPVPDGYNYVRIYSALVIPSGSNAYETWNAFYVTNEITMYGFTAGIIVNTTIIQTLFEGYYQQGYDKGYDEGYEYFDLYESDDIYDDGYSSGYSQGMIDSGDNALAIQRFIPGIMGVVFAFFYQLFSINVLGFTIISLIVTVLSVLGILAVFKLIFK